MWHSRQSAYLACLRPWVPSPAFHKLLKVILVLAPGQRQVPWYPVSKKEGKKEEKGEKSKRDWKKEEEKEVYKNEYRQSGTGRKTIAKFLYPCFRQHRQARKATWNSTCLHHSLLNLLDSISDQKLVYTIFINVHICFTF